MKSNYEIIDKPNDFKKMLEHLEGQGEIGVDTEFIREKTYYPLLEWIQISTNQKIFLVDCQLLPDEVLLGLEGVFRSSKILKIFHSSLSDQECFFMKWGWVAEPVFDSAVAAALLGYGDQIGLGKLVQEVLGVELAKGFSRSHWDVRPLPKELQEYAANDVVHLIAIYERLKKRLTEKKRWDWTLFESQIPLSQFQTNGIVLAERLAKNQIHSEETFSILFYLVEFREILAKNSNVPRQWILSNDLLLSIARGKIQTASGLKNLRGINPKQISKYGDAILEAVEKGKKSPPLRKNKKEDRVDVDDNCMGYFQLFLSVLSKSLEISSRYLVTAENSLKILSQGGLCGEWVEKGWMRPEAGELVGKELESFLKGEKMVRFESGNALEIFQPAG